MQHAAWRIPAPAGGYAPSTRSLPARTAALALIEKIPKPEKLRAIVPGCFKALDDLAKEVISLIDPSNEEKGGFVALVKALKKVVSKLNTGIHAIWHPVPLRMAGHSKNLVQVIKHSATRCSNLGFA